MYLAKAEALRGTLSTGFRDEIVKSLYSEAETIAKRAVKTVLGKKYDFDQKIDQLVTSPIVGLPIMLIVVEHRNLAHSYRCQHGRPQWIATAHVWHLAIGRRALFVRSERAVVDHRLYLGWRLPARWHGLSASCFRRWRSSSLPLHCLKIWDTCPAWRSISIGCSKKRALMASNP